MKIVRALGLVEGKANRTLDNLCASECGLTDDLGYEEVWSFAWMFLQQHSVLYLCGCIGLRTVGPKDRNERKLNGKDGGDRIQFIISYARAILVNCEKEPCHKQNYCML